MHEHATVEDYHRAGMHAYCAPGAACQRNTDRDGWSQPKDDTGWGKPAGGKKKK